MTPDQHRPDPQWDPLDANHMRAMTAGELRREVASLNGEQRASLALYYAHCFDLAVVRLARWKYLGVPLAFAAGGTVAFALERLL